MKSCFSCTLDSHYPSIHPCIHTSVLCVDTERVSQRLSQRSWSSSAPKYSLCENWAHERAISLNFIASCSCNFKALGYRSAMGDLVSVVSEQLWNAFLKLDSCAFCKMNKDFFVLDMLLRIKPFFSCSAIMFLLVFSMLLCYRLGDAWHIYTILLFFGLPLDGNTICKFRNKYMVKLYRAHQNKTFLCSWFKRLPCSLVSWEKLHISTNKLSWEPQRVFIFEMSHGWIIDTETSRWSCA